MNRTDIIRIGREAGLRFSTTGSPSIAIEVVSGHVRELERFAELVADHVRADTVRANPPAAVLETWGGE